MPSVHKLPGFGLVFFHILISFRIHRHRGNQSMTPVLEKQARKISMNISYDSTVNCSQNNNERNQIKTVKHLLIWFNFNPIMDK